MLLSLTSSTVWAWWFHIKASPFSIFKVFGAFLPPKKWLNSISFCCFYDNRAKQIFSWKGWGNRAVYCMWPCICNVLTVFTGWGKKKKIWLLLYVNAALYEFHCFYFLIWSVMCVWYGACCVQWRNSVSTRLEKCQRITVREIETLRGFRKLTHQGSDNLFQIVQNTHLNTRHRLSKSWACQNQT